MKKFGIDISKWQGDFDFKEAVKEGVSFAIIKGGGADDGFYKDGRFESNYKKAKELGIPVGAYWFSRALSTDDAQKEAAFFYDKILKDKQFELPVFIDVEHPDTLSLGKSRLTEIIKNWCVALEEKGYWVGIYSSVYSFSAHMDDGVLSRFTHWVAQWSDECTYKNQDTLGFWQFGGDTNLIRNNTVAGKVCDQNYMFRDFPKLIKESRLNGFDKEKPTEVEKQEAKTVGELAKEVIAGKWGNGLSRKTNLENAGYDYFSVQEAVDNILTPAPRKKSSEIKVGDLVKLSEEGVVYGTDTKFADFVYRVLLYVRELDGARAVISTQAQGAITGAVDVRYLTKQAC